MKLGNLNRTSYSILYTQYFFKVSHFEVTWSWRRRFWEFWCFNWPQRSHVISNHGSTLYKIFLASSIIAFISFRTMTLKETKLKPQEFQKILRRSRLQRICWPLRAPQLKTIPSVLQKINERKLKKYALQRCQWVWTLTDMSLKIAEPYQPLQTIPWEKLITFAWIVANCVQLLHAIKTPDLCPIVADHIIINSVDTFDIGTQTVNWCFRVFET